MHACQKRVVIARTDVQVIICSSIAMYQLFTLRTLIHQGLVPPFTPSGPINLPLTVLGPVTMESWW